MSEILDSATQSLRSPHCLEFLLWRSDFACLRISACAPGVSASTMIWLSHYTVLLSTCRQVMYVTSSAVMFTELFSSERCCLWNSRGLKDLGELILSGTVAVFVVNIFKLFAYPLDSFAATVASIYCVLSAKPVT